MISLFYTDGRENEQKIEIIQSDIDCDDSIGDMRP